MPQAVAAVAKFVADAVVKIVLSASGGHAVSAALALGGAAKIGVELAAVAALAAVTTPKIQAASGTPLQFKADPEASIPLVLGRTATAGNIVYMGADGPKNEYLSYITVLSLGQCQGIESFGANDDPVTFSSNAAVGDYVNVMWQYQQNGTDSETAFSLPHPPFPAGLRSEWTSDHKLSGLCATDWILKYVAKRYYTGTPKPRWVVLGPAVYDPREDSTQPGGSGSQRADDPSTWSYTGNRNPYLQALTWILGRSTNGVQVMGVGAPPASIDFAAFVEGANVCDANDWTVGGVVFSADSKWEVLRAILQAGGGQPMRLGAQISCTVQAPRVSIATLTGADIDGEPEFQRSAAIRDRFNRAIPRYRSEDHDWEIVPATPVEESSFITADGRTRTKELDFPLSQDLDQTSQLADYVIWDSREEGPYTLPLIPKWMGLRPGDCITLDEPEFSLDGARKLVVLSRHRDPQTGSRSLVCRTESDAKHVAVLGLAGAIAAFAAANPGDPSLVYPPLDSVTTDRVDTGAVLTIAADQDLGTTVTIPNRAGPTGHALLKTMDFDVDDADAKFTITISFQYNSTNGNRASVWIKCGQTAPVWTGGTDDMSNADEVKYVNDYSGPATWVFPFSGLPVGTNTLEVYVGDVGSGLHTNTAEDPYFIIEQNLKAG